MQLSSDSVTRLKKTNQERDPLKAFNFSVKITSIAKLPGRLQYISKLTPKIRIRYLLIMTVGKVYSLFMADHLEVHFSKRMFCLLNWIPTFTVMEFINSVFNPPISHAIHFSLIEMYFRFISLINNNLCEQKTCVFFF